MISERERFIVLVDNDVIGPADAIVLLEGDGDARLEKAVRLLRRGAAPRILVSGGVDRPGSGCLMASTVQSLLLAKGVQPHEILLEDRSLNTRDQAVEVMRIAGAQNWKGLFLVASNFHQYRAYLTFLKAMWEAGLKLAVMNAPARDLSWFSQTGWGCRFDLLATEFEKIEEYAGRGHIAGFAEAIAYQRLKECHHKA